MATNVHQTCHFCKKADRRYTCPRCNHGYCSTDCYRSQAHAQCSEAFYKSCFMKGLEDLDTSPVERQNMLELLKRFEEENTEAQSTYEDEDDLAARLEGLDLDEDTDEIWSRLTAREKQEFRSMVSTGNLGQFLDVWEPWWLPQNQPSIVEVLSEEPVTTVKPIILKSIPDLSTLIRTDVAPCVRYSVVSLLYAYCYVARLHNGAHRDVPLQSAAEILSACPLLESASIQYENTSEALYGCIHALNDEAKDLFNSHEFMVGVIEDVTHVIQGDPRRHHLRHVLCALSDMHDLFKLARKQLTADPSSGRDVQISSREEPLPIAQRLYRVRKKLTFFLSWTVKYGLSLHDAVPALQAEFCNLSTEINEHKKVKRRVESALGRSHSRGDGHSKLSDNPGTDKPLIEEVDIER